MRCDLCKKAKATVHITQDSKPGPVVTIHLCSRCSEKHGVDDPTGFSLADLLFAGKDTKGPVRRYGATNRKKLFSKDAEERSNTTES